MTQAASFKPLPIGKSYSVAFTPDGERLIAVGPRVAIWSLATRERLGAYRPFAHPHGLDVTRDGTRGIVKNSLGQLCLMALDVDPPTMSPLGVARGQAGCAPRFSACGRYVVDGSWEGHLTVLAADTGAPVVEDLYPGCMLRSITSDAAGQVFAYVRQHKARDRESGVPGSELVVRRWPFEEHPETVVPGPWSFVNWLCVSPDGRRLAVAQPDDLSVVDLQEPGNIVRRAAPLVIRGLAWSPDGARVVMAAENQASFHDPATLERRERLVVPHACDIAFSPDGRWVAVGSHEQGFVMALDGLEAWSDADELAAREMPADA